jgi:thiamine-monophosphate kinase
LGDSLTEERIIAIIREMLPVAPPGVALGAGDDAAVFDFASESVILTTDAVFEGIHFSRRTCSMSDIGWKAMASSVSDIAAMGGEPACALLSIAFGEPPDERDLRNLMAGAIEMSAGCHCPIIGGDICASTSGLSLTVTVTGIPHPGGPVLRSGAVAGDIIGVTGTLGDAAGGLYVLESGSDDLRSRYGDLVEAHLRPRPLLAAGQALAGARASAMVDISDGLGRDLAHICEESGTGCELRARDVPVGDELRALAAEAKVDPLRWALGGGEDYQLAFTVQPDIFEEVAVALAERGVQAARIGMITPASGGMRLTGADGRQTDVKGLGYDHFL